MRLQIDGKHTTDLSSTRPKNQARRDFERVDVRRRTRSVWTGLYLT